ncbi:hypothetical protein [Photobacterium leiognathi]|uniref:hypothetical protein n=1 Tax=Photobacterium leiognathi TaxID=553611 RepID=UPI002981EB8B|nr:hypothetical protein [Photobacterium leiognathi]
MSVIDLGASDYSLMLHNELIEKSEVKVSFNDKTYSVFRDDGMSIEQVRDVDNKALFFAESRYLTGDNDAEYWMLSEIKNELNGKIRKRFPTAHPACDCLDEDIELNNGRSYKNPYYLESESIADVFSQIQRGEITLTQTMIVPVYAYIHSDITVSLNPFGCRFDSGIIGFMLVSLSMLKEWGHNVKTGYLTSKHKSLIQTVFDSEINDIESVFRNKYCLVQHEDGYYVSSHIDHLKENLH